MHVIKVPVWTLLRGATINNIAAVTVDRSVPAAAANRAVLTQLPPSNSGGCVSIVTVKSCAARSQLALRSTMDNDYVQLGPETQQVRHRSISRNSMHSTRRGKGPRWIDPARP